MELQHHIQTVVRHPLTFLLKDYEHHHHSQVKKGVSLTFIQCIKAHGLNALQQQTPSICEVAVVHFGFFCCCSGAFMFQVQAII